MRIIVVLLFSLASWGNSLPSVHPKQFSGLWYEIARTYNEYEKKCVASTVEYTLKSTDTYNVTNRCFDSVIGGELIVYNGKGKTLQPNSASKLELTYFWVFSRQYNLVHWEEQYAIMASPDYQNVWIMSRTPQMPKPKLDELLKKLSLSMNTQKLIFTPQDTKGRYQ